MSREHLIKSLRIWLTIVLLGSMWSELGVANATKAISTTSSTRSTAPRVRVLSSYVGADEILAGLMSSAELVQTTVLSSLAKDPQYSAIHDQLNPGIRTSGISAEAIAALKPQLVIVGPFTRADSIYILKSLRIPTLVLHEVHALSDIQANILAVGKAVSKYTKAKELAMNLPIEIRRINESCPLKGKTVLNFDSNYIVYGRHTSFDIILNSIGAINAARAIEGWQKISIEQFLGMSPDTIVVGLPNSDLRLAQSSFEVPTNSYWNKLEAVRKRRFVFVPPNLLSSVSQEIVRTMKFLCRHDEEAKLVSP